MNPATATSPILQTAASTVSPESQGPKGKGFPGKLRFDVPDTAAFGGGTVGYFMASCGSKSEN